MALLSSRHLLLQNCLDVGNVHLKFEGMNPTGSFKDRGNDYRCLKGKSSRRQSGDRCLYGETLPQPQLPTLLRAGMQSVVLVPAGKISWGKLSQAVAHKAKILQVRGNFDGLPSTCA